MSDYSDLEKLAEIERELRYRRPVYARLVEKNTLSKAKADRQIAIMEAVAEDYRLKVNAMKML